MEYTNEQVFHRVPVCLKAGLFSEASQLLEHVEAVTPHVEKGLAYLRAWTLTAQGRFDEAAQILLLTGLFADVLTEKVEDILELGQTERRRRAPAVLMLGKIAFTLRRYDEAATHFLQCLTFLNERRMNDPHLRIQALFSLGCAYQESGLIAAALVQLQAALTLCQHDPEHPDRGVISYHLAATSASQRQYQQAHSYGEQALQWCIEKHERHLEGNVCHLLGQILSQQGEYQQAQAHFLSAVRMAAHDGNRLLMVSNMVALAEAQYAQRDLAEAQTSCDEALKLLKTMVGSSRADLLKGRASLICGQVAQTRSQQAHGSESSAFLEQAQRWYTQAIAVLQQSRSELAQAYRLMALLLEQSHREEQALFFWRQAYTQASEA